MSFVTRGFVGRSLEPTPLLPPDQTLVDNWPVLTAGVTPVVTTDDWDFTIDTEHGRHRWTLEEMLAVGLEDITVDIHCVTHWSKLRMPWRGVPLDRLFEGVETGHTHVMAHCAGGYTTNLALAEVLGGRAWVAFEAQGEPLRPEHGGPARLLVPHLYFWKSAKWLRGLTTMPADAPGFWESTGYHLHGDPWTEERYS
ncbi:MAG: molybdopterin-dependent oxidoreductase [Lapillicoccus sp.]